jgi:hypothetical protein
MPMPRRRLRRPAPAPRLLPRPPLRDRSASSLQPNARARPRQSQRSS